MPEGLCIICFTYDRLKRCACGTEGFCCHACCEIYWIAGHAEWCPVAERQRVVRRILRAYLPKEIVRRINDIVGR